MTDLADKAYIDEPKVNKVSDIYICDSCLDGKGGFCNTPGCVFIRKSAPDISIRDEILLSGGEIMEIKERESGNNG